MNEGTNSTQSDTHTDWQFKPDDGQVSSQESSPIANVQTAQPPAATPVSTPEQPLPENKPSTTEPSLFNQSTDTYTPAARQPEATSAQPEVSWDASGFIAHEKGVLWYVALALITVVIAALVFLFTRDWFSLVAVAAAMIVFGIMATRKPKTLTYHIGSHGLTVNGHLYGFGIFRSFGLQDEGTFSSLVFMPMKRFMLPLYAYFPPEQRDHIMEVLAHYVPFSPVQQGAIERMTHRLRF